MPVFGGKDFRTLFLTSLREGRAEDLLAKAPLTGSLLAAPAPVSGFPSWRFLDI
jgi:sugar lactone lactonase YvrE